jgi:hypothetical protein
MKHKIDFHTNPLSKDEEVAAIAISDLFLFNGLEDNDHL